MITSVSNSRVKRIVSLNQKAKDRRREDCYVVEGIKMFLEAPVEEIEEVYVSEDFDLSVCREKLAALPWEQVTAEVFRKMSDTAAPQGILCVMRRKHYGLEQLLSSPAPLLMLLEDLQDPGNLGTILRTGEGAGIDGVILSRESADIYNPKTIRSTMGSIYRVPFVYAEDFGAAIEELKRRGILLYAAHLRGQVWYDEPDYRGASAFLIGNEGNGLKPETADRADVCMKIPMQGQVESLNAAMASGILMYESFRQRRG